MNRLDRLHEIVETRADATSQIQRDLGDVRRRAHIRRRNHRLAGTFTSVVVVATVALVATAIGGFSSDHDQSVRSSLAGPSLLPVGWQPAPVTRTLSNGLVLRTSMAEPAVTFGPFGPERRWIQPASCPSPINVSVVSPDGAHFDMKVTTLSRTPGTKMGVSLSLVPAGDLQQNSRTSSPTAVSLDAAVAVVRPVEGATYRLLDGDTTLDEATAASDLLSLFGRTDSGLASATQAVPSSLSDNIHVQRLDDGRVVSDQKPIRSDDGAATPIDCSPPTSPTGLSATISPDGGEGAAIAAVIASMTPPDASLVEGLVNVDDPGGQLQALLGGQVSTRLPLSAVARDIHLISPTHAWVRYGLHVAGQGSSEPDAFGAWAELHKTNGAWKVSFESYCLVTSEAGMPCPDQPVYTPLPGAGQQINSSGGN